MYLKTKFFFAFLLISISSLFYFSCQKNTNIQLSKGLVISRSVTVFPSTFKINGDEKSGLPVINIKGNNIVVDFQGAVLQGSNDKFFPNELYGVGVKVAGDNIEIMNLNVRGFQIGLFAFETKDLKITNCDFRNNFKCSLDDPLNCSNGFDILGENNHQIAGLSINGSQDFEIKNSTITQSQNGLILNNCKNGQIYNNTITHNSKSGIYLMSCSDLKIMHNFLDWNIRGYPDQSGSAAIDASYICNDLIIAFNSITHSGKNNLEKNIVFQNDFYPFSLDSILQNKTIQNISPLPDGQKTDSKKYKYRGEKYILTNEWGPYNFEYPSIWLREINDDKYTFAIFGPEGNWKIINGDGFTQTSRQSGSVPATIVATKAEDATELSLDLEFIGVEFTDQFGNKNSRGKTFKFGFQSND